MSVNDQPKEKGDRSDTHPCAGKLMTTAELQAMAAGRKRRCAASECEAARAVIALAALATFGHLPEALRPGLLAAAGEALGTTPASGGREQIREDAWQFLADKNGDRHTISDGADRAARLLICIAWDEVEDPQNLSLLYEFVVDLINDQAGLAEMMRTP